MKVTTMPEYLFLGGDLHGVMREVYGDALIVKAFAKVPDDNLDPSNGQGLSTTFAVPEALPKVELGLVVQAWVRRVMTATDPVTGEVFRNTVYIHESVSDPNQMFFILANHLAVTWARQGEQVKDDA